jgi:hypothetical protein
MRPEKIKAQSRIVRYYLPGVNIKLPGKEHIINKKIPH